MSWSRRWSSQICWRPGYFNKWICFLLLFQRENVRPYLLGEQILSQSGPFMWVRRFYLGWHPRLGTLHFGLTGKETIVEESVVLASFTFEVAGGT